MDLPAWIKSYFDADKSNDGEALIHAFAPDAVVNDEGQSYARSPGHWCVVARSEGQVPARHRAARDRREGRHDKSPRQGDRPIPGSPVTRTFAFRLKGEQIMGLDRGE